MLEQEPKDMSHHHGYTLGGPEPKWRSVAWSRDGHTKRAGDTKRLMLILNTRHLFLSLVSAYIRPSQITPNNK
jgi:hypothetical protein